MWYHVTRDDHGAEVIFEPRIPPTACKGSEDIETSRICFAPTVEQGLSSSEGLNPRDWKDALQEKGRCWKRIHGKLILVPCSVYVYAINSRCRVVKPTKEQVPDVDRTGEVWRLVPTKLKRVGEIDLSSLELDELVVNWY